MFNTVFMLFTVAIFVVLSILFTTRPGLAAENGLYESLQLVLITLAFLVALINVFSHKRKKLIYISIGFTLLSIGFFLRELELRSTDFPEWLIYITSPTGSAIITALLFLPFILYSLRHLLFTWQSGLCFLQTQYFWIMLLAATFLFAGGVFDREWISDEYSLFFEEFFETAGYYTMAWALFKMTPMFQAYEAQIYRKKPDFSCFD